MLEEILTLCRSMGAEGELLPALAQAAVRELEGRLRPGVSAADCGSAFPLAAAMTAVELLERTEPVESFSAGDISLRLRAGGPGLSRQAERLLAPWLRDRGDFAFQGVRG